MEKLGKPGRARVEILKASTGKFQWRLLDADGKLVQVKMGNVRLPKSTAQQQKTANNAAQHALEKAADKLKA